MTTQELTRLAKHIKGEVKDIACEELLDELLYELICQNEKEHVDSDDPTSDEIRQAWAVASTLYN